MGKALAENMPAAPEQDEADKDCLKNVVQLNKGYAHKDILKTFILYENLLQQYFQECLDGELCVLWKEYLKIDMSITGIGQKVSSDKYIKWCGQAEQQKIVQHYINIIIPGGECCQQIQLPCMLKKKCCAMSCMCLLSVHLMVLNVQHQMRPVCPRLQQLPSLSMMCTLLR